MLAQAEPAHANSMNMDSVGMDSMPADSMAADPVHDSMHRDSGGDSSHRDLKQGPHHHGSPSQSEHCVFGTACSAGPIPHLPLAADFTCAVQLRPVAFASIAVAIRVVHLPQPRAPPSRLS
jgi:hypothetical protein